MWRALVVDDNFANRKLILEILKGKAECDMAANGKEALEAYELSLNEKPYDIIFLDIAMPDVSGIEVLQEIRKKETQQGLGAGEGVPIIMVTAYKEPLFEAFNKGCDDYILKPLIPDRLIEKVEEKLAK
nr:response regulator receiver domain, CheY-like [uncultured bacterium]